MTKKHFEAAARLVRDARGVYTRGTVAAIEETFVDLFRMFNPRFDADRFRAACRGEDATDSAGRTVRYGARS